MWFYVRTEDHVWTVQYQTPSGTRYPDTDHSIRECAARRVSFLNGGVIQYDTDCICGGEAR